jgi:L,D-peptidoglycan transpeptidase YkuD (ErfK/YbiS/YcfS/YnhG family)
MKPFTKRCLIGMVLISLMLSACAGLHRKPSAPVAPWGETELEASQQVLLVIPERCLFWKTHSLYACEKKGETWRQAFDPMQAVVGRNGFAPPGEKREGDGRTPSGRFALGHAFGYAPEIVTRMPYRPATPEDVWVDDPTSPDYNRWVKRRETRAASYEAMRREDDQYKYGILIEYNTRPIVAGLGSAIFLHVWKSPDSPTAGCVAISEEDMVKILGWLDPSAHPVNVIYPYKKARRTCR